VDGKPVSRDPFDDLFGDDTPVRFGVGYDFHR
jgi:hypothetical protein